MTISVLDSLRAAGTFSVIDETYVVSAALKAGTTDTLEVRFKTKDNAAIQTREITIAGTGGGTTIDTYVVSAELSSTSSNTIRVQYRESGNNAIQTRDIVVFPPEYVVSVGLKSGETNVLEISTKQGAAAATTQEVEIESEPDDFVVSAALKAGTTDTLEIRYRESGSNTIQTREIQFATSGGVSDYDELTDKPITRINADSDLPTPAASELGKRYQTNKGHIWTGNEEVIAGTDRVLSFTAFPVDTTSATGVRYQGGINSHNDLPDPPTNADRGKWWLNRPAIRRGEQPFILVDNNDNFESIAHSPDTDHAYVGAWDSRASAEASHEFTAAGQLAVFPDGAGTYQLYQVAAGFVAGTPDFHRYHFTRSDVNDLLLARIDNLESAEPAAPDTEAVTLAGNTVETLYTNEGGTAMTRAAGANTWANDLQFPFSRALVEADDDKELHFDLRFTANADERFISKRFSAAAFRAMGIHTDTTGSAQPDSHYMDVGYRTRSNDMAPAARMSWIARNRHTDGHDILRFFLSLDGGNSQAALSGIFATIKLVPSVADLSLSGNALSPTADSIIALIRAHLPSWAISKEWTHRAVGWSDTNTPTAAELAAGAHYTADGDLANAYSLPARSTNGYTWFMQNSAAPDIVGAYSGGSQAPSINAAGAFNKSATTVTYDGRTYNIWISAAQNFGSSTLRYYFLPE